MRDEIQLQINGQAVVVSGCEAFMTLSDYLRKCRGLIGTKIVCSEGDCGSCSVLCGKVGSDGMEYQPIDSCIRFMFQLDGMHIVTVEGLQDDDGLSTLQQAMVDCHGSQCGFCTPGFVIAMTALQQKLGSPTENELRHGLTGNLCRCTGYSPIIQAGLSADESAGISKSNGFSNGASKKRLNAGDVDEDIAIRVESNNPSDSIAAEVYCPATLQQALVWLGDCPNAKVVAGATDVGVQFNKGYLQSTKWMDLNRVAELRGVSIENDELVMGAMACWTDVETAVAADLPAFHRIIRVFGSPQIRHVGTIGGNIINASPIADSLPFLLVCGAQLTLASKNSERSVNINEFYLGYKQLDLKPGELLTKVTVPIGRLVGSGTTKQPKRHLRLYKISRRRDLDISSFTAAIWVELEKGQIADAGIAYGAVGPTVLRLEQTEKFLRGKSLSIETMTGAGDVAVKEITPITDVRGSDSYRTQLARNVLQKFFHEIQLETAGAIA